MPKSEPFNFFLHLFLPILVMGGLLYAAMHSLLHSGVAEGAIQAREAFEQPLQILSYVAAGGFLILAYYVPFKKLFRWTVGGCAIWICLLGLVLIPFQDKLHPRALGEWFEFHVGGVLGTQLSLCSCEWVSVLFYFTLDLFNLTVISLLIWGIINQVSLFSEAFRYYIPLAFTLSLLAEVFSLGANFLQFNLIIPPLFTAEIHDVSKIDAWMKSSYLFLIAAFCLLSVVVIFHRMCVNIPKDRWKKEPILKDFHFPTFLMSIAILFFGLNFSEELFEIPFQRQLAIQFQSHPPEEFSTFMAVSSIKTGFLTMIVKIISVFLGAWLLKKKGWIPTSLCATLIILGSGMLVWSVALASHQFPISLSFVHRAIYAGFRIGLFFALIQMTYLKLPRHERFFAMSLVELAMIPFLNVLGGEVARWIPLRFPSQSFELPALSVCFVLTILILMRSIIFLGKATHLNLFHLKKL